MFTYFYGYAIAFGILSLIAHIGCHAEERPMDNKLLKAVALVSLFSWAIVIVVVMIVIFTVIGIIYDEINNESEY